MTEVNDGARILRRHVGELEQIGAISSAHASELLSEINDLQTAIENHYDTVGVDQ